MENKHLDYEGLKELINRLYNGTIQVGKALKDSNGNIISDTYATSTSVDQKLWAINNTLSDLGSTDTDLYSKLSALDNLIHILSGSVFNYNSADSIVSKLIQIQTTNSNNLSSITDLQNTVNTDLSKINSNISNISGNIFNTNDPNSITSKLTIVNTNYINTLNKLNELSGSVTNKFDILSGIILQLSGANVNEIKDDVNKLKDEITNDFSGKIVSNIRNIDILSGKLFEISGTLSEFSGLGQEDLAKIMAGLKNFEFEEVTEAIEKLKEEVGDNLSGLLYNFEENINNISGYINDEISGVINNVDEIGKTVYQYNTSITNNTNSILSLNESTEDLDERLKTLEEIDHSVFLTLHLSLEDYALTQTVNSQISNLKVTYNNYMTNLSGRLLSLEDIDHSQYATNAEVSTLQSNISELLDIKDDLLSIESPDTFTSGEIYDIWNSVFTNI